MSQFYPDELPLVCGSSATVYNIFDYNLTLSAYKCGLSKGIYDSKHKSNAASLKDAKFAWICLILVAVTLAL